MPDHEILEQAKRIRLDLTALQGKVSELFRMAGSLPEPGEGTSCPECGISTRALPQGCTLTDHRRRTHDIHDD